MTKRWPKLAALSIAFVLVAAACGSDSKSSSGTGAATTAAGAATTAAGPAATGGGDLKGTKVVITGPERDDPSVGAINAALKVFGDANGMEITYTGDADWEANINTQVAGGNPPDIGIFPQPGKLSEFAKASSIVPLTDNVTAAITKNWSPDYSNYANVDGKQFGVPVKTDLKSIVWYKPSAFAAKGYKVPTTYKEFTDLVAKMAADGGPKPLCVGIESGTATGWPFTDWTEEMVLRQDGGDVYDQWVSHKIPFNDPKVVTAMDSVLKLWSPENVFASGGNIAATNFGDNAQALFDGQCYMHRQASFFSGFFPKGTKFADGSADAIDVFYFPDINGDKPVLTAGTYAAGFNANPATMAVLAYMASPEYAQTRQAEQTKLLGGGLSGFLSAAKGQDPSVYQPLEQGFLKILNDSKLSRFDASDLMPAAVGAGTFWTDGTSAVNGDLTAQKAADEIEASWPKT